MGAIKHFEMMIEEELKSNRVIRNASAYDMAQFLDLYASYTDASEPMNYDVVVTPCTSPWGDDMIAVIRRKSRLDWKMLDLCYIRGEWSDVRTFLGLDEGAGMVWLDVSTGIPLWREALPGASLAMGVRPDGSGGFVYAYPQGGEAND